MLYGVAGCLFCFGGTLLILIVLWGYVRRKVMKAMSEGSPAPFARKAYGRPGVALVADLIHWGFIGVGTDNRELPCGCGNPNQILIKC